MEKNNKIIIAAVVVVALIMVIGASFAWWKYTSTQTGFNVIKTSCLKVDLAEDTTTEINLVNTYPMLESDANSFKPYQFSITNECDTAAVFTMSMETLEKKTEPNSNLNRRFVASKFAKVSSLDATGITELNATTKKMLDTYTRDNSAYDDATYSGVDLIKLIANETVAANSSNKYMLRLWIDEGVTVSDTDAMNKSFISKIKVESTLTPPSGS